MKKTIRTIICAAAVVLAAVSCQKSIETANPVEEDKGTIDICVNGLMGEYTQQDGVKSSLVNNVRVAWAAGDVVYVFDGSKYLGKLTASLDKKADGLTDEDRYAKLGGTISAPATTPCVLSLVHSSLMTEPAAGAEVSELSIDMSAQSTAKVPFVAYAALEYTGTTITDVVVPFQFATSVIKVNCTGLKANTAINKARLSNVNTVCKLTLSGSAAPSVSGDANGTIIRTGDAYFAADKVNEEGVAVFQMAIPVLEAASGARVLRVAQDPYHFRYENFPKKPLSAATSVNTVCHQLFSYVPVTSVSLDRASVNLAKGWFASLNATVSPDNATYKNVTWSSDNTSVATVNENGRVTAVAEGTANITVTTQDEGKTATCKINVGPACDGSLPGEFSVSATRKVHFSRGNLYYDGENWGFEAEQYYFRTYCDGTNNGGKCDKDGYDKDSGTVSGHWGLFGWVGESSEKFTKSPEIYGVSTSLTMDDYGNVEGEALKADWGTVIDDKGTWATLTGGKNTTTSEWKYLFEHHVNVWGTCKDVPGHFVAPDGFVGDASALSEAIKDWESAQAAGIVFLPAAGGRTGSIVENVGRDCLYWSSTAENYFSAYLVYTHNPPEGTKISNFSDTRYQGYSVRLITELK